MIWEDEVTPWGDVVTVLGMFALWVAVLWAAAAGILEIFRLRRKHPRHAGRHAHVT